MSTPVPSTATVAPSPSSAPSWAAASTPSARPLTTTPPALARSVARRSATASPYGVGRRDPTMATRGPGGGGQVPRARRSGCAFDKAVSQRLHDVPFADGSAGVQAGQRARDPPGTVVDTGAEASARRPAVERRPGLRDQRGPPAELRRAQGAVEAALPLALHLAGGQDPCPDRGGGLSARVAAQRLQRSAGKRDLQVDPVQQRARERPPVAVNRCGGAPARPPAVAVPPPPA